jgi:hypothetical protein
MNSLHTLSRSCATCKGLPQQPACSVQRRSKGLEEHCKREEGDEAHGGGPGLGTGPVGGVVGGLLDALQVAGGGGGWSVRGL